MLVSLQGTVSHSFLNALLHSYPSAQLLDAIQTSPSSESLSWLPGQAWCWPGLSVPRAPVSCLCHAGSSLLAGESPTENRVFWRPGGRSDSPPCSTAQHNGGNEETGSPSPLPAIWPRQRHTHTCTHTCMHTFSYTHHAFTPTHSHIYTHRCTQTDACTIHPILHTRTLSATNTHAQSPEPPQLS